MGPGADPLLDDADWIGAPQPCGAKLAALLGARPEEVIVCDSTSVNLSRLLAAALARRPGRPVIATETVTFPTDRYVVDAIAAGGGRRVVAVERSDLAAVAPGGRD